VLVFVQRVANACAFCSRDCRCARHVGQR
jgi:hypothetical protein